MIVDLAPPQLTAVGPLGGGLWSIKDLLGHLATWEERALVIAGAWKPPKAASSVPTTTDAFNAVNIDRKRGWSWSRVSTDAARVRTALLEMIEEMDDGTWRAKVAVGESRSALGLVLAKLLTGARYGYFAHDLAHYADLRKAVRTKKS